MVSSINVETKKKKKHVSKRNKISWRKHVDIQDVEDYLEDQRLEERLGTPFADRPDSELFVIDTQPSLRSQRKALKDGEAKGLTAKQRKRLQLPEVPRCFQTLVNGSKVSEPSGIRNNVKPPKLSAVTEKKRLLKGVYKKKLDMANKNRALHRKNKQELKDHRTQIDKDVWGEEEVTPEKPAPPEEWLSKDTRDINKPRIRPPRPGRKASKAKAVVIPHPGASYNPSFEDHQQLMQQVAEEELKEIKKEEHLRRVTKGMFRKVTPQQKMQEQLSELQQGLNDDADATDDDDEGEYRTINPPVRNRKKDPKKKRHMREENMAKAKKRAEVAERKKLADVYKLKHMQKQVVEKEIEQKQYRELRKKKDAENPPAPRINSTVYKEPPPTFLDIKDLTGNLRGLTPLGGGLIEHFTSLQRRGLAPVSVPNVLKKAKKKRFTLMSHKMPWEITEGHAKPSKKNPIKKK